MNVVTMPDAKIRSQVLPDARETPTLTVEYAGALLGLGRGAAYAAVRSGSIPVLRLGGVRLRVRTVDVLAMLGFAPDGITPLT